MAKVATVRLSTEMLEAGSPNLSDHELADDVEALLSIRLGPGFRILSVDVEDESP